MIINNIKQTGIPVKTSIVTKNTSCIIEKKRDKSKCNNVAFGSKANRQSVC